MTVLGASVIFLLFAAFFVISIVFMKGVLRVVIAIIDGLIMLAAAGYVLCAFILVSAVQLFPLALLPTL